MSDGMAKAAVIGAGISGMVCASELAKHGFEVTVYESGRGVGGRMATRRVALEDGSEAQFDHGCDSFGVSTPEFAEIVREWESAGAAARWEGARGGCIRVKKGGMETEYREDDDSTMERYVGIPSMNAVCKHLEKGAGVKVVKGTRVLAFERVVGTGGPYPTWSVLSRPASDGGAELERADDFHVVVCSDKQAASQHSLRVHGEPPPIESADVPALAKAMQSVQQEPRLVLMMAFRESIDVPFDFASVEDHPMISHVTRNSSKPGRYDNTDNWVVHSTKKYAVNLTASRMRAASTEAHKELLTIVADEMLAAFQDLLADITLSGAVGEPEVKVAHRWGSAFPVNAVVEDGERSLMDGDRRFLVCGDYCMNAATHQRPDRHSLMVEAAVLSGKDAAARAVALCSELV